MHAALPPPIDGGRILDLDLLSLRGDEPNGPDFLGNQHAAVRQESHPPGQVEVSHGRHRERQAICGFLPVHIYLRPDCYLRPG